MKKLAGAIILFGFGIILNGCYTVVQGDYHYTDNSQDTIIIVENPIPQPPPPFPPPPRYPVPDPYIPPHTPVNPPTKERIVTPERESGSSKSNNPRDTGGRDNGGRNGNSR